MIKGRDLIISADGKVIAAAKSCDINVSADTIEVSSLTQGAYKEFIAGLKSWSIGTSHLLPIRQKYTVEIEAVGYSSDGAGASPVGHVRVGQTTIAGDGTRGLCMVGLRLNADGTVSQYTRQTTDTYQGMQYFDDFCQALAQECASADIVVLISHNAYQINADMQTAIATNLGVSVPIVTVANAAQPLAIVAVPSLVKGSLAMAPSGIAAHTMVYYNTSQASVPTVTPLKDMVARVGTTYTLTCKVDGLPDDVLTGTAICTEARITGSTGSLAQGSFQFKGSGALA